MTDSNDPIPVDFRQIEAERLRFLEAENRWLKIEIGNLKERAKKLEERVSKLLELAHYHK